MVHIQDLFVHCYVVIDDLIRSGQVLLPPRPGPTPACSDAEVLTIDVVRHLLGRRSESGFLREVATEHADLFPVLPHHSEFNRRVRWLWGAFDQIREALLRFFEPDEWAQVDTSALPVKHPSRVRGPDSWVGAADLVARFGRDAAHGEWFYGFRLAIRTDLGSRLVRAWSIVPAAVNERDLIPDLLSSNAGQLRGLMTDKGFASAAVRAELAEAGITHLVPPPRPNAPPCRPGYARSSPPTATGSRPRSAKSPTRWNCPATAPTPSGA